MNTLASRMLLAFGLVILLAGTLTAVLAGRSASGEMRHLMMVEPGGQMKMTSPTHLRDELEASYARVGGWTEAAGLLDASEAHMRMMGGALALVDLDGTTIAGAPVDLASASQGTQTLPLTVAGRIVGWLVYREVTHLGPVMAVDVAVSRVNRSVWLAAIVAGMAAFACAWLLVRTISRPLERLTAAVHAVARGDLATRVPPVGPSELRSLAEAFNHMAADLTRQESLRRTMLADTAHELRTPLAVIQGQAEALLDGVFPPTTEHLQPLVTHARQLARLIEDLRTLADSDANELTLDRCPVDLAALISALGVGAAVEASARAVALTWTAETDMPAVDADPVRLNQVLANVVANALRHTPAGGRITISAERSGASARVSIADTGPGIAAEDLPRVFERLYRADPSRSRASGGSGLGLAIARRLTEAHGGTITIASQLGHGTTVTLLWPLVPDVDTDQPRRGLVDNPR